SAPAAGAPLMRRGNRGRYAPRMELNGTSAVISGGASGLGEATARVLAAAGVTVVIADLNESRGKQIADEIGGQFARTDVTDETSVQAAVDLAVATGEPLRTGVSCAGIGWASRTVGRDGTPHDLGAFQKVIAVNLVGTFNVMRIAASAMAKTEPADADGQRGVIINTSSVAGIEGQTGQIAYSASKGGIIGMTVPAARDLSVIGVRVNTICPGIIDTPIYGFSENADEFKARLVAPVVFPKRMGRPDEFGHLVRSLIENDYMNADVVRFDGGIRFQPKLWRVASAVLGQDVDPAVTEVAGQERAGRRAYRRRREGGRLQRTARESLSEGPGWATGRGPRAGGRKVAAIRTVQLMRASIVIGSIVSDSVTKDAEIDSRKPNRPALRLMMRAPSVEAV